MDHFNGHQLRQSGLLLTHSANSKTNNSNAVLDGLGPFLLEA